MKKIVTIATSLAITLTLFMTCIFSFPVEAGLTENMNTIEAEAEIMSDILNTALDEYSTYSQTTTRPVNTIPPDFNVLFVRCSDIIANGVSYPANVNDNAIFNAAAVQFEELVEEFTNYNVNIIVDTYVHNDPVSFEGTYVMYEDIKTLLDEIAPFNSYDSVFIFGTEVTDINTATTSLATYDFTNFGYTYSPISHYDYAKANIDDYKYTTELAIHEFVHHLAGFYYLPMNGNNIIFPHADGYTTWFNPTNSLSDYSTSEPIICSCDEILGISDVSPAYEDVPGDTPYYETNYYSWNESVDIGNNPHMYSYYQAVLSGTLWDKVNQRYIGMYPSFWKLFSGRALFGQYYAKNDSGQYLSMTNNAISISSTVINSDNYKWIIEYDIYSGEFVVYISTDVGGLNPISYDEFVSTYNCTFTKVNFDAGEYFIKNKQTGKCMTYIDGVLSYTDFTSNDNQKWSVVHHSNGNYTISPKNDTSMYFDVVNASGNSGAVVQIRTGTGNANGQTWQFRLGDDGYYNIVPACTTTNALTLNNGSLTSTALNNLDTQKWDVQRADGEKEVFEGEYTLKCGNKYISMQRNENNVYVPVLSTANTTNWEIKRYSDNYYFISPVGHDTMLYWDVMNNYDIEGNLVLLNPETGYMTAQTWKFMMFDTLNGNGNHIYTLEAMPMLSLTRAISFGANNSSDAVISTSNKARITLTRVS